MKNKSLPVSVISGLLLLLIVCTTNAQKIDRGRIEDSFTLKITGEVGSNNMALPFGKPIIIKPNAFFSLSELGLQDHEPVSSREVCTAGGYKKMTHTYNVEIENPDSKQKFYGRIVFFTASRKASAKAVTSYYRITFPPQKFAEASDGRISFYYEYYDLGGSKLFPTWILWVSDVPIK